ncbi:MAG: beta-ketoacyl-ACP reductase [Marmoricola sp.]|nr:beta-ketoacyl-ACP reductase [Marmoricola sp.]
MESENLSSQPEKRVALVTGAGRNIGRAIALDFARVGLAVAVNSRSNRTEGEAVVREIEAMGGRAMYVQADVGVPEEAVDAARLVEKELGPVDVLVNNAAVRPHTPFLETSLEEWNWVIGVGLTGPFVLTQAVVPGMIQNGAGLVINIGGRDGHVGMAKRIHGSSVKAGLMGLTKSLALELGPDNIRVNLVVPSFIDTSRPKEWYPNWEADSRLDKIPLRRLGRSEDIARACTYLLDAEYVTGQTLHVNGGIIMP